MFASTPGALPSPASIRARSSVYSRAVSSISVSATERMKSASSASSVPPTRWLRAMSFSRARRAFDSARRAMPKRSCPSRNLAYVQPLFSSPMRFSTGTSTSVRWTVLISRPPSMVVMGRTSTPGACMSMSKKEIPSCGLASGSVRTRQNIMSAQWAAVVQVLVPLTT